MAAKGNNKGNAVAAVPLSVPADESVRAWVQLARAYHRIARRLEQALDEHSLTLAQFEVLARLHFDGAITQNELAQRLLVTKGNICGLLDRMASADLVTRQTDPTDRRANKLFLTKAGRALLAGSFPKHIALIKELLGELPPRELRSLERSLQRLAGGESADISCHLKRP